jgi:hypothetical protein
MDGVLQNPDKDARAQVVMLNPDAVLDPEAVLSPFKVEEWRRLTPSERLHRAWALRRRLTNPRAVHDRELFPAP